jgi:hypothetical protein
MSKNSLEGSELQSTTEELLNQEYFVPFSSEEDSERITHNFSVLKNLPLGAGVRRYLRIGEGGYGFRPTEVYNLNGRGQLYLTGEEKNPNRMAFYTYGPQPSFENIEVGPQVKVYRRELIMKQNIPLEENWAFMELKHSCPELNLDFHFLRNGLFPKSFDMESSEASLPLGRPFGLGRVNSTEDSVLLAFGWNNRDRKFEGDTKEQIELERVHGRALRYISKSTRNVGGLEPKGFLLQLSFVKRGEIESLESELRISL